ncbi:MAG: hypothetical protein ACRBBN_15090 [Methyloligellaceae bacterium]
MNTAYVKGISGAILGVIAIAGVFILAQPVSKAEAGSCKSNVVSREIKARYKSLGKQRARANWSKKARQRYGWKYRKWSKARPKGYHISVRGQYYLLYRIRAHGTPCK